MGVSEKIQQITEVLFYTGELLLLFSICKKAVLLFLKDVKNTGLLLSFAIWGICNFFIKSF